jgi:predicted O-linked N-acetylglucosamine transferase (SPINDLY family)
VIAESREHIADVRAQLDRELDELLAAPPEALPSPETSVGMAAFYVSYHGLNDRPLLEKLGRVLRRCYPAARTEVPARPTRKRRRIGFVSTYFQSHSIGRTTLGWIRDLPREQFEVYVVSIAPKPDDPRAEDIRRAADHYVAVPATLEAARRALLDAGLDVLIFADIGMHPLTYYLAFWRMAPVQLVAWGHPVTTGIDTIDGFLSAEALEATGSDNQYSEKLLRLGGFFMPRYARPERPPGAGDRASLGLPKNVPLYGCPQTLFKLHPDFDDALVSLMERDPQARIVMVNANRHWAAKIGARLRTAGAPEGRLLFVPPQSSRGFHELLACCDVLLDPFHFGGNNSTLEGLALGVPIVTLPAAFLRGRFTLGHYREMGYDGCIADSPARYVELAHRLATEPDANRAARAQILASSGILFDRPDAGRHLGEALLALE